ncbi:E3 ubiquitin-protein ligase RNF31 isoform X3 [Amphiprion ocellaris]|uniref:E3 ubiquitin-protein ligase RNF31 isoform X3 n=1 Tax=Amphiprion ocellaris TaxID=80972 RepID=UPI000C306F30|nr:E3 ubiquitin-protein ligase RNF31 isoform X3 [Amphiprion ocellaris]
MQRVSPEAELRTLAECRYSFPAETLSDLQSVRARFSDLRLYVDFYCFPNKEKKKLVYLAGTLPVYYEGAEYNIPVCIWLHETHPVSRPRCYVCPSVAMVINPSCPYVDASGNISVDALNKWSQGMSDLSQLVSEIRRAFQKDTPLFTRQRVQAPPPAGVQVFQSADSVLSSSSSQHRVSLSSSHLSGHSASQLELCRTVRAGRSYTEDLLGIDFSAPPPSPSNPFISSSLSGAPLEDPLTRQMGALRLDEEFSRDQAEAPVQIIQSEATKDRHTDDSGAGPGLSQDLHPLKPSSRPGADIIKMASRLPPDQAAVFLSLMAMEGRSFIPTDVMEAVQLNRDFQSALRFLCHSCPICQEQVSFSKIITMTHCSCFLCQSCFKLFFLAAIKERSVDQLVCPQCGQPEVRGPGGLEGSMDYFNLLDTQIRHFLPPEIHELFQRKLRDRALQEMPNFCWCAHCSFGMLHEADSLRIDCPSCKKSTCSKCRSPWFPQHQSLSCEQFRVWKQKNQPDHHSSPLLYSSIECPNCQLVFSLSKGGCLHFTCSQCRHQFCGGCSQRFTLGSACGFSADCGSKGLHAHHPRDCLYHLRDWSVTRLHLLLQHYSVSPSWLEAANGSPPDIGLAVCLVLELRDDSSRQEEPCGRPALPEYRGYCHRLHYKEYLVELINRYRVDPAVLFSLAEMTAELQRWQVAVPTRKPDEPEGLYTHRLRLTLTNSVPLRKQRRSLLKLGDNLCPLPTAVVARAPPPHLLLSD